MMPGDDVLPKPVVRRVEVFTGAGRRRRWSAEAKARIVAESYATSVGEVAEQYGLSKTQLFTWRRDARGGGAEEPPAPIFAPVVVEPRSEATMAPRSEPKPKKSRRTRPGGIELEIDGVVVRVERGAEARTVATVIQALKRSR